MNWKLVCRWIIILEEPSGGLNEPWNYNMKTKYIRDQDTLIEHSDEKAIPKASLLSDLQI